jgi:hypothetical protein
MRFCKVILKIRSSRNQAVPAKGGVEPVGPVVNAQTTDFFNRPTRTGNGSTNVFLMRTGNCFYYAAGPIVKAANKRIAKAHAFCYSDAYPADAMNVI